MLCVLLNCVPDDRVGVGAAAAGALGEDGLAGGADDVSLLALVDGRARDLHADGALQLLLELLQLGVAQGRVLSAGFTYLRWQLYFPISTPTHHLDLLYFYHLQLSLSP